MNSETHTARCRLCWRKAEGQIYTITCSVCGCRREPDHAYCNNCLAVVIAFLQKCPLCRGD